MNMPCLAEKITITVTEHTKRGNDEYLLLHLYKAIHVTKSK